MAQAGGRPAAAEVPAASVTFADVCARCGLQLRIVDDLPPEDTDFAQCFRGSITAAAAGASGGGGNAGAAGGAEVATDFDGNGAEASPSQEPARVEQLMALAALQSEVDFPVCVECLNHVVADIKRHVDQAAEEHQTYQRAHDLLQQDLLRSDAAQEAQQLLEAIDALEAEEQRLTEELAVFTAEEAQAKAELAASQQQRQQAHRDEEDLWLKAAEFQLDHGEHEEERIAAANATQCATQRLNRLKRTNVLNDMFHIAQDGPFGTINKLRIGRLPDQVVPPEEVNAAWGHACLLLDALIKKCGMPATSCSYRLDPHGSYSAIKAEANGEVLELYSSDGGFPRFFSGRRLDVAMVSFLGCLQEVTQFLQRDPTMRLPFKIEGDKVGGFSIRVQFNQDERWTKALKFMLTDLKWIIAFVESRGVQQKPQEQPQLQPQEQPQPPAVAATGSIGEAGESGPGRPPD